MTAAAAPTVRGPSSLLLLPLPLPASSVSWPAGNTYWDVRTPQTAARIQISSADGLVLMSGTRSQGLISQVLPLTMR